MRCSALRLLFLASISACAAERPAEPGALALEKPLPEPPVSVPVSAPRAEPTSREVVTAEPPGPELHSKARNFWIYSAPDASSEWIGYLWTGASVRLKSDKRYFGPGCSGPFYELEAGGFVCENGKLSTLDADDRVFDTLRAFAPNVEGALPYHYGESLGLVRYRSLPSVEIQRRNESDLSRHLASVAQARRGESVPALLGVDVRLPSAAPPPMPEFARSIHLPRSDYFRRSTVAYTREARWGNRGFLLTADYGWIPKDRVKPYTPSAFRGVRLGVDARLPLAFFRTRDRPEYGRGASGALEPTGKRFPRLSFVELSGESVEQGGERFLETTVPGIFVMAKDAVVPQPMAEPADPTTVEVSIDGGWLLAYEGKRPVYATLISPGRGGTPVPNRPTLETASTPVGSFSITLKIVTATMEAPTEFVHSDVPWVQNFTGPYSLHTAYWHDDWGDAASAGCVNLSPADARWLFEFSEPRLPEGWHAVRKVPAEASTRVILRP
ncbi:MAG TPA: L,D-transpeptidase [Polyangiaceae bacterium]